MGYSKVKRIADILVSLIGGIVLIPLFLLIAAVVHLDSSGKVLFQQKRAGKTVTFLRFTSFVQ
ncbi:MAG: sugar transferase [Lachnospiraceae bacterium]|nr:sugar transferase [Lachnospiraceae bacterium]